MHTEPLCVWILLGLRTWNNSQLWQVASAGACNVYLCYGALDLSDCHQASPIAWKNRVEIYRVSTGGIFDWQADKGVRLVSTRHFRQLLRLTLSQITSQTEPANESTDLGDVAVAEWQLTKLRQSEHLKVLVVQSGPICRLFYYSSKLSHNAVLAYFVLAFSFFSSLWSLSLSSL